MSCWATCHEILLLPSCETDTKDGMTSNSSLVTNNSSLVTNNSTSVTNNSTVFNGMVPIGECLSNTSIELRDIAEIKGGVEGTVWIGMY